MKKEVQKLFDWFRGLRTANKVSLVVIIVVLAYLCLGRSDRPKPSVDMSLPAEERIQQVNMNQGKLCVLKIDAATSLYHIDKMTRADMTPYEVWLCHSAEVDVVVDLTKARVYQEMQGIRVSVPAPEPDSDTLNIRPANLKRVGSEPGWFRTEAMRTAVDQKVREEVRMDLQDVVARNFPASEARQQAVQILKRLYEAVGCKNVVVVFESKNADVNL